MGSLADRVVREPDVATPHAYRRRVRQLAAAYATLFVGALVGIGLVLWKAQFFVTLSQRSNVETLTLAFVLIFLAYLAVLAAPGALGALHIAFHSLRARRLATWEEGERAKVRALARARGDRGDPAVVGLDTALERAERPGAPFSLMVADRAGSLGEVHVDGVALTHRATAKDGSNALLAYFAQQVNEVLGEDEAVSVVVWKRINDEETAQYLNTVRFARNLERHFGAEELWPKRTLTDDDCTDLERRLSAICPALRDEAFLPHWEYEGQHQLPLIPEPLGLISLSRSEKRVDPLASMGCAVLVVLGLVAVLALLIAFPPWVPGS